MANLLAIFTEFQFDSSLTNHRCSLCSCSDCIVKEEMTSRLGLFEFYYSLLPD